jgi:hypothetical protein
MAPLSTLHAPATHGDDPLNPLTDFHALSLRDLLEARDLFHLHLTERKGVIATAVGRYLIREADSWPGQRPVRKHHGPKLLSNVHIRPYSWPCVIVFVDRWVPEHDLRRHGYTAGDIVPNALHMPNGKVVPVCVVEAPPMTETRTTPRSLVFPKEFIGGGYPVIANVQEQEHFASIGCLVTDGHTIYAATSRHVTGTPGEVLYSELDGKRCEIGVSSDKQLSRLAFKDIYKDWPGQDVYLNADVGLIRITDATVWTPQVYSIGVVDRLADLSIENISLQLVKAKVRAYGCASGELFGRIWALFYRYKSVGGFEYVADLFIGARPNESFQTYPGDSGTLWLLEPPGKPEPDDVENYPAAKKAYAAALPGKSSKRQASAAATAGKAMLRPIALQWGGQAFHSQSARTARSYALTTFLSTVCNHLEVDLVRDWGQALPEYWGTIGHFTIANIATTAVQNADARQFFKTNLLNITFQLPDITAQGTGGLSKKEFVPLADVPDLAWKTGAFSRGPRHKNPEEPNHFADMDEPPPGGGPTLLDLCKNANNVHPDVWIAHARLFKTKGSADPAHTAGLLPFRVWQIFDEMLRFAGKGDAASFLTAAGVLAHYVGDACQPLHISYLHHGDPADPVNRVLQHTRGKKAGTSETVDDSANVHEDYEQNMFKGAHGNDLKTRLGAKVSAGRAANIKSGREAALATIAMMRDTFTAIPPAKLVKFYNKQLRAGKSKGDLLDALWNEFRDDTVDVMAGGCRLLGRLWSSAWEEGQAGSKIRPTRLLTTTELINCYKSRTFLQSYWLTEIGDHLDGLPKSPAAPAKGRARAKGGARKKR